LEQRSGETPRAPQQPDPPEGCRGPRSREPGVSALGRGTPYGLHQAVDRADEEVDPPDNSLAIVQPRGDGVFGAELAAGPRGRDPRKESL